MKEQLDCQVVRSYGLPHKHCWCGNRAVSLLNLLIWLKSQIKRKAVNQSVLRFTISVCGGFSR